MPVSRQYHATHGRTHVVRPAGLWWVADIAGAILFAACLALLLGRWPEGGWSVADLALLAGMAASGLVRAVVQGRALMSGQNAAEAWKIGLRGQLLAALLPTGLARGALVGEDLRVAIDDVEATEGLTARFEPLKMASILSPLLIASCVAFASWVSALILLLTLVPFGLGMALAGLAGKDEAERQFQALSRLSGLFVDRVAALPMILSFGAEDRIARQMGLAAQDVAARTMQVLRIAFVSSAMLEFFAALSVALVAVYCGFSLLGLLPFAAPEDLTLTRAFFALAMAPEFYLGMRRLAAAYHDKQQGEAATASINAALAKAGSPPPTISASAQSRITLDNLEIVYADDCRIGPVSATFAGPGLHLITGETGSGKSSLLHALIGMAPVGSGSVMFDEAAIPHGGLAGQTGWAGQRPLLLPGTLGDNLRLGSIMAADDLAALIAACGLAPLVAERGLELALELAGFRSVGWRKTADRPDPRYC